MEYYHATASIYGTTGAKGLNARSGNDLVSIDHEDKENGEVKTSPNVAESSHPKAPPKRKAKSSGDDDDILDVLWDKVSTLPDFDEEHLAHYYAHLVDNPKTARAFMKLSQTNKVVWNLHEDL
uniref:Uncharacterized protein n=1 Tax=Aegilops tauschii TaxID=37682 RepID=M8B7L6_AEGTA